MTYIPNNRRFSPLALAAIATIGALSLPFAAANATENNDSRIARHTEVYYGDLDLSTQAGQQQLEQRMDAAARKVCGTSPIAQLRLKMDYLRCMEETKAYCEKSITQIIAAYRPEAAIKTR